MLEKGCVKNVRIRSYSGPHFLTFGLNTERDGVSLHIQSECWKISTIITPNTDTSYAVRIGHFEKVASASRHWYQYHIQKLFFAQYMSHLKLFLHIFVTDDIFGKVLAYMLETVCCCHVTYAFQNESTLYSCLNVKELLARSRREI